MKILATMLGVVAVASATRVSQLKVNSDQSDSAALSVQLDEHGELLTFDVPADLAALLPCDEVDNPFSNMGTCHWMDEDTCKGNVGMFWYSEDYVSVFVKCAWTADDYSCGYVHPDVATGSEVCTDEFYIVPSPSMTPTISRTPSVSSTPAA